jgi:neutral ceramidase
MLSWETHPRARTSEHFQGEDEEMRHSTGGWMAGLAVVVMAWLAVAADAPPYRVGVATEDITPKGPIWLSGYGSRNKPSEGVDHPLHLKALALQAGEGPPLVLITADIIGFPRSVTEAIADRLRDGLHVPRANVMTIASHTHTGPVIAGRLTGMFDLKASDAEAVTEYARKLPEHAYAAAERAVRQMEPARLSFGRGRASFAMNRRVFAPGLVNFGANPDGPVDHEVPVLRVENPNGSLRAILFGYACHCTTLNGDWFRVSGDWAGFAQDYLERAHPGATVLFVTGCGGDANPEPRGTLALAREHGLEMAGAVSRVLKQPGTPVAGPVHVVFERAELPLAKPPARAEYEKRLKDQDAFVRRHARRQLDILDGGGQLPSSQPCPVQVWQFGKDLTLVALGGEVVVDYAKRLKRELRQGNLWVTGYANDVFAYVPSARILLEGGYEADYSTIYYGLPTRFDNRVEEVLIGKVHELVKRVRQ